MTKQEIIKEINQLRLADKHSWWVFNKGGLQLKGYGTWVQIFRYKDITNGGSPMGLNVTQFNSWLNESLPERIEVESV